jgi:urea transport system permease protein
MADESTATPTPSGAREIGADEGSGEPKQPAVAAQAAAAEKAGAKTPEEYSRVSYERSRTFLSTMPDPAVVWLRYYATGIVLALFFVVIPLLTLAGAIPDYKLNLLGKYLCFAIVGVGVGLIWGYTGLLSLCQALFFCLGGYAMAMHLSLKEGGGDVRPEYNNIPQFMFFNNVRELPWFWKPFTSMGFSIFAGLMLPCLVATVFGFFIFRSRVRGVYFSIVTQAVAWGAWLLISRNEMLLGGTNGLTNFYKPMMAARSWIIGLYLLTLLCLVGAFLVCRAITKSRLGRILVAVRDRETRLYFAGYQPYAYKIFSFAVGAMAAAVGGMLYSPQVGIITPQNMSVPTSILMVIWVALGGRGKLWGGIYGAILVNVSLGSLSSDLPNLWMYVQGGMFLAVVLFFPDGFVGLWDGLEETVRKGEGWLASVMAAGPIVILGLWVLMESLGVMPAFLRMTVYQSDQAGNLRLEYVVLVVLLAGIAVYQQLAKRKTAAATARANQLLAGVTTT